MEGFTKSYMNLTLKRARKSVLNIPDGNRQSQQLAEGEELEVKAMIFATK